jgi:hypothetical protein
MDETPRSIGIDLYWLPLGAGGNFVRLNGRIYEAITARMQGRAPCDLYHSGLQVSAPNGRYVIEMTPVRASDGPERGVVGEGPVGARWAGRFKIFRYELRCWLGGVIPDLNEAVESPQRLSREVATVRRLLELVPEVPMLVWGRDEIHAGEMWNSNSMMSWLLARSGVDMSAIKLPVGGRAPGWDAGLVLASRRMGPLAPRHAVTGLSHEHHDAVLKGFELRNSQGSAGRNQEVEGHPATGLLAPLESRGAEHSVLQEVQKWESGHG